MVRLSNRWPGLGSWLLAAAWCCGLLLGGLLPASAVAGPWQFTKVADLRTPLPGMVTSLNRGFENAISRDGHLTFIADGINQRSLMKFDGLAFTPLVSRTDELPGTGRTFETFDYSLLGQNLLVGGRTDREAALLELDSAGTLTPLFNPLAAAPNSASPFLEVFAPTIQRPAADGSLVFRARSTLGMGIYRVSAGAVSPVVNSATPIPGRGVMFDTVGNPVALGDRFLFSGGNSSVPESQGIYEYDGSQVMKLADGETLLPQPGVPPELFRPLASVGPYGWLGEEPVWKGEIFSNGGGSLYQSRPGPHPLANDCLDPAACASAFGGLYGMGIDAERDSFAFAANFGEGPGQLGDELFYSHGPRIEQVLGGVESVFSLLPQLGFRLDLLEDGFLLVNGYDVSPQALTDQSFAFVQNAYSLVYDFPDLLRDQEVSGIFIATRVPEPASGLLALIASVLVLVVWGWRVGVSWCT